MPTYDFLCNCGHRFERFLRSYKSANPDCEVCARPTSRVPSRVAMLGAASIPEDDTYAPKSFEGTANGNRELIAIWQRKLETRRKFEEKHPEHKTTREAIAAHEGAFENNPLTYRELASRAEKTGDATAAAAEASRDRGVKAVPKKDVNL